jgi:nucleoside-diphosphate-sugar epimerase
LNEFNNTRILIVGGAGFCRQQPCQEASGVGSAPAFDRRQLALGGTRECAPSMKAVTFIEGSITNDAVLDQLTDDLGFCFSSRHLSRQSKFDARSARGSREQHLHDAQLYERLKNFSNLKRVVYSSAGCTVAEKTYDKAEATQEDAPVSLYLDSPYQISKIIGELYSNYYFQQHQLPVVKARFQNVYGPGEILGAGRWRGTPATVWRNVTPTFRLSGIKGNAADG